MGLYDEIIVAASLPDCGYELPQDAKWQTKDLDSLMDVYRITVEGRLERYNFDREETDEMEHLFGEGDDAVYVPVWHKRNERWETVPDIHQDVRFYNSFRVEDNGASVWIEYVARFTDGTLTRIALRKASEGAPPTLTELSPGIVVEKREVDFGTGQPLTVLNLNPSKWIRRKP